MSIPQSKPCYSLFQLSLLYCGLFVFLTFAFTQPYTSKVANICEALLLLDLLLISALYLNLNDAERVQRLATALLLIPFIVTFFYLSSKAAVYIW